MNITIKQAHIVKGKQLERRLPNYAFGPIALAIKGLGHTNVAVFWTEIFIGKDRYVPGESALEFMRMEVNHEVLNPCTIELIPAPFYA